MELWLLPDSLEDLPESKDELDVHLQLTAKQNVEVAEEEAIKYCTCS